MTIALHYRFLGFGERVERRGAVAVSSTVEIAVSGRAGGIVGGRAVGAAMDSMMGCCAGRLEEYIVVGAEASSGLMAAR